MALYTDYLGGQHELPQQARSTPFGVVMDTVNLTGKPIGGTSVQTATTPISGGTGGVTINPSNKKLATDMFQSAIDTANMGLQSAREAVQRNQTRIDNAGADLAKSRLAADALAPYAQQIGGEGDALSAFARSLLTNNLNDGGLAGEYLGTLDQLKALTGEINPDRYVSLAASDTQAAYDNAAGQQQRALARQGVSPESGASQALRQQYSRALAAALAGAKTNARRTGMEDQLKAYSNLLSAYQNAASQATSASQAAASNWAAAAGIVEKQGSLYANIGGMEVNLGELDINNEKLVQSAIQDVESAQQEMGKFYQNTMTQRTSKNGNVTRTSYT